MHQDRTSICWFVISTLMHILRIILRVTRPYCYTFLDLVYRPFFGTKRDLPPIDNKFLLISATELARKIRKKQLKCEDVIKAYIKRIKEVDPIVNACIDERFDAALNEAKDVDTFVSTTSKSEEEIERETPLLGVPFSCKEPLGIKGLTQSCGILAAKNRKALQDGVCPSLCRKAGAIPLTVTNVPELCNWWDTENIPFGRTVNPYDSRRSAGGSTGGEAAILGYAGAVFGIGNDIGGSIRLPAAFNGIYGMKPSPGMISNEVYWPEDDQEEATETDLFLGTGPMCRYVKDLRLLTEIMSEGRINFEKQVDFKKLKIYYMEEFPGFLLEPLPEIKTAVKKAIEYFRKAYGSRPFKLSFPELRHAYEIWQAKYPRCTLTRDYIAGPGKQVNLFNELLKWIFARSEHTLQMIYEAKVQTSSNDRKYFIMYKTLKQKLDEVLCEEDALLIIPTHPEPAPHHFANIPNCRNAAYTTICNFLSYPAVQIPAGDINGLPIGIQAISGTNRDYITILAAEEMDKVFGGWRSPCKIVND